LYIIRLTGRVACKKALRNVCCEHSNEPSGSLKGGISEVVEHPSIRKSRHYFADSGGRSVGIVRLRTKATEFSFSFS
jgi:hypothetical protein